MAVLVLLSFSPPGRRLFVPKPGKGEVALERRLDDVRFENVPLDAALKSIGDRAGAEIVTEWTNLERDSQRAEPITLRLHDVTVRSAITSALDASGLFLNSVGVEPEGSRITVDLIPRPTAEPMVRLYDVTRLIDQDIAAAPQWTRELNASSVAQTPQGLFSNTGSLTVVRTTPSRIEYSRRYLELIDTFTHSIGGGVNGYNLYHLGRFGIEGPPKAHRIITSLLDCLSRPIDVGSTNLSQLQNQLPRLNAAFSSKIVKLDLDNVTFRQALARVQDLAPAANIVLPSYVDPFSIRKLHLQNITVEQSMETILAMSNGGRTRVMRVRDDGSAIITDPEETDRLPLMAYDVRALVRAIMSGRAAPLKPDDPDQQILDEDVAETAAALDNLVLEFVGPDSADEPGNGHGYIHSFNGRLIVEHSTPNQLRVLELLRTMHDAFISARAAQPRLSPDQLAARQALVGPDSVPKHDLDESHPYFMDLSIDGVTIMQAIRQIAAKANMELSYSARDLVESDVDLNSKIHLKASEMTVETAIRIAFDAVSKPGTVEVFTDQTGGLSLHVQTKFHSPTRIYDVRDLLEPGRTPPGEDVESVSMLRNAYAQQLMQLVVESIDRDSWQYNGGTDGKIRYIGGRFVVRQSFQNHEAIERLLEEYRKHGVPKLPPIEPPSDFLAR